MERLAVQALTWCCYQLSARPASGSGSTRRGRFGAIRLHAQPVGREQGISDPRSTCRSSSAQAPFVAVPRAGAETQHPGCLRRNLPQGSLLNSSPDLIRAFVKVNVVAPSQFRHDEFGRKTCEPPPSTWLHKWFRRPRSLPLADPRADQSDMRVSTTGVRSINGSNPHLLSFRRAPSALLPPRSPVSLWSRNAPDECGASVSSIHQLWPQDQLPLQSIVRLHQKLEQGVWAWRRPWA